MVVREVETDLAAIVGGLKYPNKLLELVWEITWLKNKRLLRHAQHKFFPG
jgi:hypothetical protein